MEGTRIGHLAGSVEIELGFNYHPQEVVDYSNSVLYGMQLPGRHSGDLGRFGFNGMEQDPEVKGEGNSYTTEFRQYDPRIGRWLTLDPLMSQFPWMSPYVAFDNNPVFYTDPYGLSAIEGGGNPSEYGVDPEMNPDAGSEHADNSNITPNPPAGGLSFNSIVGLLNPKTDPVEKAQYYKTIQTGTLNMNSDELETAINGSSSGFVKDNKEELLQIKNLSVKDGVLTLYTDAGKKYITLEGKDLAGENKTLYVKNGAKVNTNGLNVTEKTFKGKSSSNPNSKDVTRTALSVSGTVTFQNFESTGGVDLIKEVFKTKTVTVNNGDFDYKALQVSYTLYHGMGSMDMGFKNQKITW